MININFIVQAGIYYWAPAGLVAGQTGGDVEPGTGQDRTGQDCRTVE